MNSANFYIYAHYIPGETLPFYIGKGSGYRMTRRNDRSIWWKRIVNKYGFEAKLLHENLSYSEANILEKKLIKEFGRRDIGTGTLINHTDGGEGIANPSKEVRNKISESNRKRVVSEETKRKISQSSKGHKLSEHTKSKMKGRVPWNKGMKGISGTPHTEETKQKISDTKRKVKEHYMENKSKYTTILISKEINKHIREFCDKNFVNAGPLTEMLWSNFISSSVSGSIVL
jgi:hypothetical protein